MKSRHSWILSVLAVAALAAAPAAAEAQSGWGLVGGVNFATFGGDDAESFDSRTGFVAGLFGAFPLGQVLTFRPELVYTQKGAAQEVADTEFEVALDYIEIPVLLRIGVPGVGMGLHALAGPTLSFEVDCTLEAPGLDESIDCDDEGEGLETDDRKKFLVGGQVGAGVDFPLGAALLSVDGRYQFDLENLTETEDLANRVWSITASVGFPLGG